LEVITAQNLNFFISSLKIKGRPGNEVTQNYLETQTFLIDLL